MESNRFDMRAELKIAKLGDKWLDIFMYPATLLARLVSLQLMDQNEAEEEQQ